jgi:hypothetical protein
MRLKVIPRLRGEVALKEPDGAAFAEVNGGDEKHGVGLRSV